jgi:hypothetical protein
MMLGRHRKGAQRFSLMPLTDHSTSNCRISILSCIGRLARPPTEGYRAQPAGAGTIEPRVVCDSPVAFTTFAPVDCADRGHHECAGPPHRRRRRDG